MPHFIDSVADLTARSDRDELEVTLATVTAKLALATELRFWQITGDRDGVTLRERVRVEGDQIVASEGQAEAGDSKALDDFPELRNCYERKTWTRISRGKNGPYGHVLPVAGSRGIVGFLEIYHPQPMGEDQRRLLTGLLSIYQNHLKILDASEYDELTGLLNRKTFDAAVTQFQRADGACAEPSHRSLPDARRPPKPGQSAWLAVLDIDFFKRINDRFGHLYGDEVLILLARLMRSSFREKDRLFRCGGEEFIVILAPTEVEFAEGALERFRAIVQDFQFPQVGRVTVSIGYTRILPGDNGLTAFGRADEALYVAKRNGRNQVLSYESLVAEGALVSNARISQDIEMF